ncbi:MAG TPA: carbonic anhydrase family protein [Kiritimatiellia bacterium]|nr:carbonic anhydrase family protein [Kiritimatiellia bacterium]
MKHVYVALCVGMVAAGGQAGEHWSYAGETGPERWALLSPEFSSCAGQNQSPVDLQVARMIEADLAPLAFDYKSVALDLVNNGHTIQANVAPGSSLVVDGISFALKQFHFHCPSENLMDGRSYPLEAHLVHADADGHLAVVAVLFEEGAENALLRRLWSHMPKEKDASVRTEDVQINAADLLPEDRAYYRYNGSLTTPPCTEGVRWLVCKQPVTLSPGQVEAFLHVLHHPNNRPVQPQNARPVLK